MSEYYTLDCQEAEVDVWKLRIFCEPPRWMHVYYYYYFVSTRGQFFFNGLLCGCIISSSHVIRWKMSLQGRVVAGCILLIMHSMASSCRLLDPPQGDLFTGVSGVFHLPRETYRSVFYRSRSCRSLLVI